MKLININDVSPETNITSIDDVAAYLSLMYRDVVDDLLEYITIYNDSEMIQEPNHILNLNYICVVEPTQYGLIPVGYITRRDDA